MVPVVRGSQYREANESYEVTSLSEDLQTKLLLSFNNAMQRDWSIPNTERPLNDRDLYFLRNTSVKALKEQVQTGKQRPNELVLFILQVAAAILIQKTFEESSETPKNEPLEKKHANRSPASSNPEVKAMKEIALKEGQKASASTAGKHLKEKFLEQIPNETSKQANEAFIKHAGKVVGAAAATATFASKVEEVGFHAAAGELAKSTIIDFAVKYSVKTATTLVGCTNPVWCASFITTVIKDCLTPIDTADPNSDMYGHLPKIDLPEDQSLHLPDLNPHLGPSLRSPPSVTPRSLHP